MNAEVSSLEERPLNYYRTEIPNIVFTLGLTPYELALYCHLRRTAGQTGKCYKSVRTLVAEVGMSNGQIVEARKALETKRDELGGKPLILTRKEKDQNNQIRCYVTITDIWLENMTKFSKGGCSRGEQGCSSNEQGCSRGERKKEPLEERTQKEDMPPAGAEGVGSVSGNEGEEEKFPHPSPKEFVTFWNGFSEFEEFVGGEMSGSHRKTLASLRKHEWFRENWQDAIRLVAESDFHTGRTEENFHASPKWFFTQGRAMAWCGKAMRAKRIKTQPPNQKPKQTIKLRTEKEHVPAPEKSPEEQERELQEFLKTLRPKGNGSPIMA